MVDKPDVAAPVDDDDEYDVIVSASQVVIPKPKRELVKVPEVRKDNGKKAQYWLQSLNGAEAKAVNEADKVMENGVWTGRWDRANQNEKLIWQAARDPNGHLLWETWQAAVAALEKYPIAAIRRLADAANELSAADPVAAEKK
jgi:hypothetical protein